MQTTAIGRRPCSNRDLASAIVSWDPETLLALRVSSELMSGFAVEWRVT